MVSHEFTRLELPATRASQPLDPSSTLILKIRTLPKWEIDQDYHTDWDDKRHFTHTMSQTQSLGHVEHYGHLGSRASFHTADTHFFLTQDVSLHH